MRKIIVQHAVGAEFGLLEIGKPINHHYAKRFGFEYYTDTKTRCADRPHYWEKIAYLREFLPKVEDGTLVVWEDADSINVGNDNVLNALPAGGVFGMVQNRGGLNSSLLLPWYNSGVMAIVKSPLILDFFGRVWDRGGKDDEVGIVEELKASTEVPVSSLDPKWNCWLNNEKICPKPVIRAFHGVKLAKKLAAMQDFLAKNPLEIKPV